MGNKTPDRRKRITAYILSGVMLFFTIIQCAEVFGATVSENKQWTFLFMGTGYISDTLTEDDLTIIGRDGGSTRIDEDKRALILGKNGSTEKACIKLRVKGPCRLYFNMVSMKTYSAVAISDGTKILGEISVSQSSKKAYQFDYIGKETDLYIYSQDNSVAISIFAVNFSKIVMGDVTGDNAVKEADATALLRHISGITELTDGLKFADFDLDGNTDLKDVIKILIYHEENKYSAQIINVNTSNGTVVSSSGALTSALREENATVYVADDIEVGSRLNLKMGGQSIIGIPKADGTLPVLNFKYMGDEGKEGIRIRSADNTIANLVIENANDNGILLKSENANEVVTGNTIKNCIVRYNNDSGVQITKGAYNNTVENVISYRNCDIYERGSNADGFAVKLGAGVDTANTAAEVESSANTFINCYAWENSDDGWDSYDSNIQTYNVSYKNCMCWNNGNSEVHLGYTDYINGLELDEELPFMRYIAQTDPTGYAAFKNAYNNKTLCAASASKEEYGASADAVLTRKINTDIGDLGVAELLDKNNWRGNPNGFKLGSVSTESICQRTLENCIAFDHGKKGIDRNNAMCNISLKNCISFDNNKNYKLDDMNITGYESVYGWDGASKDDMPDGYSVETPSNHTRKEDKIRGAAQAMVGYAQENKIGRTDVFE